MFPIDLPELLHSVQLVLRAAGYDIADADIQYEWTPAPHHPPSSLPTGMQAVYCFILGDQCLKVGKAGPNSAARYVSHHYGASAPSTLAKSIASARDAAMQVLRRNQRDALDTTDIRSVGAWIRNNTGRLNVLAPASAGPNALSLIEAFLQCRLKPLFEGAV